MYLCTNTFQNRRTQAGTSDAVRLSLGLPTVRFHAFLSAVARRPLIRRSPIPLGCHNLGLAQYGAQMVRGIQSVALARLVDCVDFKFRVACSKQSLLLPGPMAQKLEFFPHQPYNRASATLCIFEILLDFITRKSY